MGELPASLKDHLDLHVEDGVDVEVIKIGEYTILKTEKDGRGQWYRPWIGEEDSHRSYESLDAAIAGAISVKSSMKGEASKRIAASYARFVPVVDG